MSIQVKDALAAWRTVTQPWVKTDDTTWRRATKVFVKVAGVWREAWPLQPGPTGAPVTTTAYRNDRIEMDVSWTAPTTGEPATKYIVSVGVSNQYATTVEVAAPATSMTLTNGGNGFHTLAGWGAQATVQAVSAAGRFGPSTTGAAVTISQLPAPPPPTSYSVSMWQCALHHTWAHPGGRRITGVEMHIYHNSAGAAATYDANTYAADYQSWNTATIGGGTVACYLRTTGPGGISDWVSVSGEMPNPISTSGYRFGDGYHRVNTSGVSPAVQVHTIPNGGGYSHVATFGGGAGEVYDPGSVNNPRDRRFYGMILRPVNQANGWVGRDQWLGWVMKIPNPHYIGPIDSRTFRGVTFRPQDGTEWQGAAQGGLNAAFFFYGNQFYDYLSIANVGYEIGVTGALLALHRENFGGSGSPVSPQLMVHRAGQIGEDINWGGSNASNPLGRGQLAWVGVPPDWAYYLKERLDGWKGIGLYHPNQQLLQGLGYTSAEYMGIKSWNYGTIDNGQFWLGTTAVFHSG